MKTTPEQRVRMRAAADAAIRAIGGRAAVMRLHAVDVMAALDDLDAAEKRIAELEAMADEPTVLNIDSGDGRTRVDFDIMSVWVGPVAGGGTGCIVWSPTWGEADDDGINAPSIDDVIAGLRRAKAIVEGK